MKARIHFYRIERCGYFKRNGSSLGTIPEILDNLQEWISGKSLNETQTYSADDTIEDGILPTYCYSVVQRNGDYLLTTWNKNADVDGKMASIDGLGKTGEAKVEKTKITEGYIPGYPAFFWFIPEEKAFATIQFNNAILNGKKNLERYLKSFLEIFSFYTVYSKDADDKRTIIGYGTKEDYSYRPFFITKECINKGDMEYIRKNRENISKMIKKDNLKSQRPETKEFWQRAVRFFLGANSFEEQNCITENKIRIEINGTPSKAELEGIISSWNQDCSLYKAADVGFSFKGKSSHVFWLKQAIASTKMDLDIRFVNNDVLVNPEDLLSELHKKQERILKEVRYEKNNTIS